MIDRGIGNEYSDEDEEQEFSSNEDNDDGLSGYAAKRNYASKRDNYRKLERNENDPEVDENLGGAQGDSDSDFEVKVKGSRANKMSRVSFVNFIAGRLLIENFVCSSEISSRKLSRYWSVSARKSSRVILDEGRVDWGVNEISTHFSKNSSRFHVAKNPDRTSTAFPLDRRLSPRCGLFSTQNRTTCWVSLSFWVCKKKKEEKQAKLCWCVLINCVTFCICLWFFDDSEAGVTRRDKNQKFILSSLSCPLRSSFFWVVCSLAFNINKINQLVSAMH